MNSAQVEISAYLGGLRFQPDFRYGYYWNEINDYMEQVSVRAETQPFGA